MTDSPAILIATDNTALSGALNEQCDLFGLSVSRADTPDALTQALDRGDYDAVVVTEDFCPEGMSQDDLLADCLAATNYTSGVLLLCGPESAREQRIPGIRPLSHPLRLGRFLGALAGCMDSKDDTDHGGPRRVGPYMLYPADKLLRRRDGTQTGQSEDIRLTDKEVQMLVYLHERAGEPVTRENLLQDVWQYSGAVMTRTLETHIYRLRQKIEDDPSNAVLLCTESGGYSLAAENGV